MEKMTFEVLKDSLQTGLRPPDISLCADESKMYEDSNIAYFQLNTTCQLYTSHLLAIWPPN